jgi:septum formation protein
MLVLASASPRRHELLNAAGLTHVVRPADIPEIRMEGECAESFVRRLAREKAEAVAFGSGEIVLAADTVVAVDDQVFGKPVDDAEAAGMLRALSGRSHLVYTGFCLRSATDLVVDSAVTRVQIQALTDSEIADYIETGEPQGKAGAYAIQGLASKFVESIEGSYHNVMGLPVSLVYRHLKSV